LRRTNSSQAFTLVEMLVVVAILLVLLSLLLPSFWTIKMRARRIVDLNNLRQFAAAAVSASVDRKGALLPGAKEFALKGIYYDDLAWFNYNSYLILQDYLHDSSKRVFACISFHDNPEHMKHVGVLRDGAGNYVWDTTGATWWQSNGTHISWNYFGGRLPDRGRRALDQSMSVITNEYAFPDRVAGQATSRTLATCGGWSSWSYSGFIPHQARRDGGKWLSRPSGPWGFTEFSGMNMCYTDGSARWVPYEDFAVIADVDWLYYDVKR
jgi:prepilin-type N-terminal cleavage/methylation domain-containing protein